MTWEIPPSPAALPRVPTGREALPDLPAQAALPALRHPANLPDVRSHSRQPARRYQGRHHHGSQSRRRLDATTLALASVTVLAITGVIFPLLGGPRDAEPSDPAGAIAARTATTAAATTSPTAPRPSTSPAITGSAPIGMPGLELEVLTLTNALRASGGCRPLQTDLRLVTAARGHSADMARYGYLRHTDRQGRDPGERVKLSGYPTDRGWAENIGRGYTTAQQVMKAWVDSPSHRAVILDCDLKSIGVGVERSPGGELFWTTDLGGR